MHTNIARSIERALDHVAAAALGGAIAYVDWAAFASSFGTSGLALCGAIAAAAYAICFKTLARIGEGGRFTVAQFAEPVVAVVEVDELVLTTADRLRIEPAEPAEPLMLDDILAEIGPDSRVVQLFDASRMPSPGQLNARIREHLSGSGRSAATPDASQALHQALAELRSSLG